MKKQLSAWIQASRLPSQSFIFFPILLGQAAWVSQGGSITWWKFVLIQLFGLFDQLYIVYANDYADYRDDRLNNAPTIFSGGSRVLVDNLLKPVQLKTATIILLPVGAFVGLIIFVKALPGTPKITAFVSMAVITTLSLIAGVTLSMFGC